MNCKTCAGPCCLKGSNHEGDCEGYKPMTHYEQIKAMSVEEMAEFINGVEAEAIRRAGLFITVGDIQRGKEGWLDWLQSKAE